MTGCSLLSAGGIARRVFWMQVLQITTGLKQISLIVRKLRNIDMGRLIKTGTKSILKPDVEHWAY